MKEVKSKSKMKKIDSNYSKSERCFHLFSIDTRKIGFVVIVGCFLVPILLLFKSYEPLKNPFLKRDVGGQKRAVDPTTTPKNETEISFPSKHRVDPPKTPEIGPSSKHQVDPPKTPGIDSTSKHQVDPTPMLKNETSIGSPPEHSENEKTKPKTNTQFPSKPICDTSNLRTDVCDIAGDVRIHGKSATIAYYAPMANYQLDAWHIKPYPRKLDKVAMRRIREITIVQHSSQTKTPLRCTTNHTIPAVVFSNGGYTGNHYHEISEVLLPLFITSRRYHGEVRFLVTNIKPWWIEKFKLVLSQLSRYDIIDFDKDDGVHCFKNVVVGLHRHGEFEVKPELAVDGASSLGDYARFMRHSFRVPRDVITNNIPRSKKIRLLIISRARSRVFMNLNEIIKMAKKIGYEVVAMEAKFPKKFAEVVNSVDVMMGVHGAGLANLVFLPVNATLVQLIPWGKLDGVCESFFGKPAKAMGLRYVKYKLEKEETSLVKDYQSDDPILTHPEATFIKGGWGAVSKVYLTQNVTVDVGKLRSVLLKVHNSMHQ